MNPADSVKRAALNALCRKHPGCAFLCFTNATLIGEKFCQDMIEVKNFISAISAEGFEETTDARCGEGAYKRIQHGMELLHEHGLPFGVSTCLTRCARLSSRPTTMSSHSTATTCDRAPSSTTPIAWRKWCARLAPTPPTSFMKKAPMACAPSARNPRSNGIPLPPSYGTTPDDPRAKQRLEPDVGMSESDMAKFKKTRPQPPHLQRGTRPQAVDDPQGGRAPSAMQLRGRHSALGVFFGDMRVDCSLITQNNTHFKCVQNMSTGRMK